MSEPSLSSRTFKLRWLTHAPLCSPCSCAPNCELQRWCVDGLTRIGIFTIEDVRRGEELCYDYQVSPRGSIQARPRCSTLSLLSRGGSSLPLRRRAAAAVRPSAAGT